MQFGFIYSHPLIYYPILWILYRGKPLERFRCVARKIEDGQTVLDLCAGTDIFFNVLNKRAKSYTAVDINPVFTRAFSKKGITAITANLYTATLPVADVVIMNTALYHFKNDLKPIITKMLNAARSKVIIMEPVHHYSASDNKIIRFFARRSTKVDGIAPEHHFSVETFTNAMNEIPELINLETLDNKKDMIAVLQGKALEG